MIKGSTTWSNASANRLGGNFGLAGHELGHEADAAALVGTSLAIPPGPLGGTDIPLAACAPLVRQPGG